MTSATPAPIGYQIRERLSRIIAALQPIAASTGPFSDVRGWAASSAGRRQVQHELEPRRRQLRLEAGVGR
jgi:hypothetical protein